LLTVDVIPVKIQYQSQERGSGLHTCRSLGVQEKPQVAELFKWLAYFGHFGIKSEAYTKNIYHFVISSTFNSIELRQGSQKT
jgi:hypothetical protein